MKENRPAASMLRIAIILAGLLAIVFGWVPLWKTGAASPDAEQVQVKIDASQVTPRPLEDVTEQALVREYSAAWRNLAIALSENRTDLLSDSFTGYAMEKFGAQIAAQKHTGLSTRYLDHGHKVDALFYPSEGSAVELRDTARLEIQHLDGDKVISSETTTRRYYVIMTVVDDRWKVRVLDSVPGF